MEYTPRSRTRLCDGLVIGFFLAAVCAFCVASFMSAHKAILQIVGLCLLTAAVYTAVRYALTTFRYVLSSEDGEVLFTVYRAQGRRSVAECRMPADRLLSVSRFREKRQIPRGDVSFYDYTASIGARDVLFLVFDGGSEKNVGVAIEADNAFAAALEKTAERNTVRGEYRGEE